MQILVMYYSKTGNTKKLAEEVANGVHEVAGVDCVIKAAAEVQKDDFIAADGIIAGSAVYFGGMAAELKSVFDRFIGVRKQMTDKVGAAFATSGDPSGGKELTIISIMQAMLAYGMMVVGDPLDATGHFGVSCTGTPDERTIANARKLGNRVATLAKKMRVP